jgi:pimeloyl-ACP methyl ester carboxylesterase
MTFALNHPEYVQSLTICAGVSESNLLLRSHISAWSIAARLAVEFDAKEEFMHICAPLNYSAAFLEETPSFIEERAKMVAQLPDSWFTALTRLCDCFNTFNVTEQLPQIKAPVLLISGTEDILKPPSFSELIKKQIPHAESVIVMGSGHAIVIEKAEEFNSMVVGFIDRHCYDSKNLVS